MLTGLRLALLTMLLTTSAAHAESVGTPSLEPPRKKQLLAAICAAVGGGTEEDSTSANMYIYHSILFELAGVRDADDPSAPEKISRLWLADVNAIYCTNSSFIGGSVIKYAIHNRVDEFVTDVTRHWRLPPQVFNGFDKKDGRTVLDFVADEVATGESPAIRQKLQLYYKKLQAAGAKHRVEIDGIECRREAHFRADSRC